MSEDEKLKLLSTNGMLVKRPLLIGDDFVLVGFKETEWEKNSFKSN
jgi:arsenate reductase